MAINHLTLGKKTIRVALEVFNHTLLDITNYNKTGPLLQAQKQGTMSHLDVLEAEAIHIMREVALRRKPCDALLVGQGLIGDASPQSLLSC